MPLKDWCSIHAVWSIPYVSVAFFPSLKQNFIAYHSSKGSSCPDCIFEIYQLWQSGFSRVYSNSCCSCSFQPEIIKIGLSSHKIYSNNILNFQESTTILNTCTKKSGNLFNGPCTSLKVNVIAQLEFELTMMSGSLAISHFSVLWWGSIPQILESVRYLFITIIPRSTLTQRLSIFLGPIYGSNRYVWKLLVLNKNCELNYHDQKIRRTRKHNIRKHWTAVSTLLGLISSVYRDLHHWRSN